MATKTAKATKKTAPKKTSKSPVKKAAAKNATKPVVKAKSPKTKLAVVPKKKALAPKESIFARLLREKAERHEQFQKQNNANHHGYSANQMPHNHASFSKFAGPRRRAS